jgi:hypothetical protein
MFVPQRCDDPIMMLPKDRTATGGIHSRSVHFILPRVPEMIHPPERASNHLSSLKRNPQVGHSPADRFCAFNDMLSIDRASIVFITTSTTFL